MRARTSRAGRAAALSGVPVRAAGPVHGPNGAAHRAASSAAARHARGRLRWPANTRSAAVFVSRRTLRAVRPGGAGGGAGGLRLVLSDIPTFRELWDGAARFVDPSSDPAAFGAMLRA